MLCCPLVLLLLEASVCRYASRGWWVGVKPLREVKESAAAAAWASHFHVGTTHVGRALHVVIVSRPRCHAGLLMHALAFAWEAYRARSGSLPGSRSSLTL